jgi:hypothetical protein
MSLVFVENHSDVVAKWCVLSKYEAVEVSSVCVCQCKELALTFRAKFSVYFCDLRCTNF